MIAVSSLGFSVAEDAAVESSVAVEKMSALGLAYPGDYDRPQKVAVTAEAETIDVRPEFDEMLKRLRFGPPAKP